MVNTMDEAGEQKIREAVAAAEAKTSAEIVVMVVKKATDYRALEILVSAMIALAVPAVLLPFLSISAQTIWVAQIGAFVALTLLAQATSAGRFLAGPKRFARDLRAAAEAEFFAHGLRRSSRRAAVLVFVALREHRIEIVCDDAAVSAVPEERWAAVASHLGESLKRGELVSGLENATGEIAELLAPHHPHDPDGDNELPDLIVQ